MLKKIQEFFCEDCLTKDDLKEALDYAGIHNCICKLIFDGDDPWWYRKKFEYIFPDDTYEMAHKRLYNKFPEESR